MAGTLAHELNQPLTALTNLVNAGRRMMANGAPYGVDTVREVLGEAAEQALRAGEIIRRLREFVTRGETEMRIENLPDLIREASELASAGTGPQGVQVGLNFDPRAETVFASRIQLQQVVLNLIRYPKAMMAIKSAPPWPRRWKCRSAIKSRFPKAWHRERRFLRSPVAMPA
jgi:C4-dicarboxylate-specific signal transduction histidine kinase